MVTELVGMWRSREQEEVSAKAEEQPVPPPRPRICGCDIFRALHRDRDFIWISAASSCQERCYYCCGRRCSITCTGLTSPTPPRSRHWTCKLIHGGRYETYCLLNFSSFYEPRACAPAPAPSCTRFVISKTC